MKNLLVSCIGFTPIFTGMGSKATLPTFSNCETCAKRHLLKDVSHEPLADMLLIDTLFRRVAVDLIGLISPACEKGYRYILSLMAYATRHPEDVPIQNIKTFFGAVQPKFIFSQTCSQHFDCI